MRGFRPPFANGFSAFLGAQSTKLDEAVADAMVYEVTFEEDSHPPLRERLEALGEPNPDLTSSGPRATSLLRDLPAVESTLIASMVSDSIAGMDLASIPTPGKPVAFTRDGHSIEPFAVALKLQKGELTAAQWDEECRAAGLA